MIKVINEKTYPVVVAINTWLGDDCQGTGYYQLAAGSSDNWVRKDIRGYIMTLGDEGCIHPYFVATGDNIVIRQDGVYQNNSKINPIGKSLKFKLEELKLEELKLENK